MKAVLTDARIEKAIRRLKAMGLKVNVLQLNPNEGFIFVSLDSFAKLVRKQIKYPNVKVEIESNQLVIYVWRSQR